MAGGAECPDASRPEAPPPATHAAGIGVPAARPAAAQDAACFSVSSPAASPAELGSAAAGMPPAAHPAAELAAACLPGSQLASSPAETAATNATAPAAAQPTPQRDAARPDASQHAPPTLQQEPAAGDNRVRVRITSGWPPLALPPVLAEAQLRMQARLLACWQSFWPSGVSLTSATSHVLLSHTSYSCYAQAQSQPRASSTGAAAGALQTTASLEPADGQRTTELLPTAGEPGSVPPAADEGRSMPAGSERAAQPCTAEAQERVYVTLNVRPCLLSAGCTIRGA